MKWFDGKTINVKELSGEKLARKIAEEVYPLSDINTIYEYPQFVKTAYFIIAFDRELNHGGIYTVTVGELEENLSTLESSLNYIGAKQDSGVIGELRVIGEPREFYGSEYLDLLESMLYPCTGVDIWSLLFAYLDKEIAKFEE